MSRVPAGDRDDESGVARGLEQGPRGRRQGPGCHWPWPPSELGPPTPARARAPAPPGTPGRSRGQGPEPWLAGRERPPSRGDRTIVSPESSSGDNHSAILDPSSSSEFRVEFAVPFEFRGHHSQFLTGRTAASRVSQSSGDTIQVGCRNPTRVRSREAGPRREPGPLRSAEPTSVIDGSSSLSLSPSYSLWFRRPCENATNKAGGCPPAPNSSPRFAGAAFAPTGAKPDCRN